MLPNDSLANVLYIDMTKKRYWVERRADLFGRYLGGSGVAAQLLEEECPGDCDPLGPENPIVFAVGPLTGLFPLASKTVVMFRSPHTGGLGESHCGGRSAVAIRGAGYGAIVIRGMSETPLYLSVQGNRVYFRNASSIWGMENSFTVGRIIRENESGAGVRTIMRIGGGGERLVTYACVTTETYRHFGRLGLGAVFGSKKLKGVVIAGQGSLPVRDKGEYRGVYEEIYRQAVESSVMKKYHDLGTAENVLPLNRLGGLPTRNLKSAGFEGAEGISGEAFAEQYLGRRLACSHCPVGCIHIATLREPYADEPYFYKTHMISYDYEPIYALGAMLGIGEARGYLRLMEEVEIFGLDAMSTGVVLAWATEAQERGIISERETMGLKLRWGEEESYIRAVRFIVRQPNEFYRALAKGVRHASSIYGGEEYALQIGGNEMPGYHTGPAAHIGVLLGARHSHLDNAGYSVDQRLCAEGLPTPGEVAEMLVAEESWRQVLSSLVVCFFARGIYKPETVLRALRVAGFDFKREEVEALGKEILLKKRRIKGEEVLSSGKLDIPGRIFEVPSALGVLDREFLEEAIDHAEKLLVEEGGKLK